MASKAARGTKRTCQNSECGARFYDLERTPIVCPICETDYVIASSPIIPADIIEEKPRAKPKKAEFSGDKEARTDDAEEAEGDEALADIEDGDEEIAGDEDETFLEEEEEEGGDISNVIGGAVGEGEEEA